MRTLIIYSSENTGGLKDATGAFIPESKFFAEKYDVPDEDMLAVNCRDYSMARRREAVCSFLRNKTDVGLIGIFCHGYPVGLQVGFRKHNCDLLVRYLKMCCRGDVKIILYACSTGSNRQTKGIRVPKNIGPATDGGFADTLRDWMLLEGFRGGWIDAHKTAGHTTRNPYVLRFYTEELFESEWNVKGGEWLVSPKSVLWGDWRELLKTDFRFRFPLLTEREIYKGLS